MTAENLVRAIGSLDSKKAYNYVCASNKGVIKIEHIQLPEGPITIKRWNVSKGGTEKTAKSESISAQMLWRIANAFMPNLPINFDRILGGSYNTRSVLEALLAHTPEFYWCRPGRIENQNSTVRVCKGHKHLLWHPDASHKEGVMSEIQTDMEISEIPVFDASYKHLTFNHANRSIGDDITVIRRHLQIQIALYMIGLHLGYRTWIAQNDMNIVYNGKKLCEYEGVIRSIKDENTLFSGFSDMVKEARLIDCIWFKGDKEVPAVMEVEHSTGVTSWLDRMLKLKAVTPGFKIRYIVVAPEEDREKVFSKANCEQYKDWDLFYFSYAAVEELYSLCMRRKPKGVMDDFIECYMEPIVKSNK